MSHITTQQSAYSVRYNAINSWNSNTLNLVDEEDWSHLT